MPYLDKDNNGVCVGRLPEQGFNQQSHCMKALPEEVKVVLLSLLES